MRFLKYWNSIYLHRIITDTHTEGGHWHRRAICLQFACKGVKQDARPDIDTPSYQDAHRAAALDRSLAPVATELLPPRYWPHPYR